MPSRALGSATPGSAGSTRCSPRSSPMPASAPVIVAQRLRKGSCGSPRGAKRLVGDAVKTTRRLLGKTQLILVRMDSAFYSRGPVHAALKGGAAVSVTVRMDQAVKKAIAAIDHDAWTMHRVHRRRVRRDHRPLDLSRRGRRGSVHCLHLGQEVRTDLRTARGPPDPGLQRREEASRRAEHLVRRVALPRVLHHRRPRDPPDRRSRQDPPPSRGHRTGPLRPEELRAGPPAVGGVHRQRRLAGARGHRVQPHPRRWHRCSTGPGRGRPPRRSVAS